MSKFLSFVRKVVPFESIWLVINKILIVNKLTRASLVKLIVKDEFSGNVFDQPWWSSNVVSINKLETLLQLGKGQLQDSYIENTIPIASAYLNCQIRHCNSCIGRNYHSSLFSIPYLMFCPWHGDELVDCASCRVSINMLCQTLILGDDDIWGHFACGHVKPLASHPFHKFSSSELEVINQWCNSFVAWLLQAESIVAGDIFIALSESARDRSKVDFLFNYLEPIIGLPFSRRCNEYFPVVRISLPRDSKAWLQVRTLTRKANRSELLKSECIAHSEICYKDMIASMKSVRRFITKRFLSRHKKCLRRLRGYTQEQRLSMKFECRCSFSIAYSCWMLQLLEIDMPVSLSNRKKIRYRCPRYKGGYPKSLFKVDLVNSIAKFHGIWACIEFACDQMDFYKIDVRFISESSLGIYNNSYFCVRKPTSSKDEDCSMSHYLVEPSFVNICNLERCQNLSSKVVFTPSYEEVMVEDLFTSNTALVYRLLRSSSASRNTFYVAIGKPRYPTV